MCLTLTLGEGTLTLESVRYSTFLVEYSHKRMSWLQGQARKQHLPLWGLLYESALIPLANASERIDDRVQEFDVIGLTLKHRVSRTLHFSSLHHHDDSPIGMTADAQLV